MPSARPWVVATSTLPAGGTSTIPTVSEQSRAVVLQLPRARSMVSSSSPTANCCSRGRGRPCRPHPVEIHDRARGGPDGGNGRLDPVAQGLRRGEGPTPQGCPRESGAVEEARAVRDRDPIGSQSLEDRGIWLPLLRRRPVLPVNSLKTTSRPGSRNVVAGEPVGAGMQTGAEGRHRRGRRRREAAGHRDRVQGLRAQEWSVTAATLEKGVSESVDEDDDRAPGRRQVQGVARTGTPTEPATAGRTSASVVTMGSALRWISAGPGPRTGRAKVSAVVSATSPSASAETRRAMSSEVMVPSKPWSASHPGSGQPPGKRSTRLTAPTRG